MSRIDEAKPSSRSGLRSSPYRTHGRRQTTSQATRCRTPDQCRHTLVGRAIVPDDREAISGQVRQWIDSRRWMW